MLNFLSVVAKDLYCIPFLFFLKLFIPLFNLSGETVMLVISDFVVTMSHINTAAKGLKSPQLASVSPQLKFAFTQYY